MHPILVLVKHERERERERERETDRHYSHPNRATVSIKETKNTSTMDPPKARKHTHTDARGAQKRGTKREGGGGEEKKKEKGRTAATRIPAWSPTAVLTSRYRA